MTRNNTYTVNPILSRATTQNIATIPLLKSSSVSNMSVTEKGVLSSVVNNMEPNQFAYSYVNINGSSLSAITKMDTLYVSTESPIGATIQDNIFTIKITEDANHLFVTQAKITEWDNKAAGNHIHKGEDITSGVIAPEVIGMLPISKIVDLSNQLSFINNFISNAYTKLEIDTKISALQDSVNQLILDGVLQPSDTYSKIYIDGHFATIDSLTAHVNSNLHITTIERNVLSYFSIINGKVKVSTDFFSTGEISAYGAGAGGGSIAIGLNDIVDVTITTPLVNNILLYNGNTWVNVASSSISPTLDPDLTAIASLSNSSVGYLKKTAMNTWQLDNINYLPTALGTLTGTTTINKDIIAFKYTGSSSSFASFMLHDTTGNECLGFGTLTNLCGFRFKTGFTIYPSNTSNSFMGIVPDFEILQGAAKVSGNTVWHAGNLNTSTFNAASSTYASTVTITSDNSTNITNYPLFVNATTGNLSPRTDTGFTYNPSTGTLTTSILSATTETLSSTLNVQGISTLRGITVSNGTNTRDITVATNTDLVLTGIISSYTYTLPATIGWYRIAMSPIGISRCRGSFDIDWTLSGYHGNTNISVGIMYSSIPYITQNRFSSFGNSITKARIVYHTTYTENYAYIEVYNSIAQAVSITVRGYNLYGWSLVQSQTTGSIPTGYTNKELTLSVGYVTSGNILSLGEITAYYTSDIRLKTNVTPLIDSLDIINKMNPVSYNWNNIAKKLNPNKNDTIDVGLIAQELSQILPNLVHDIYGGEYKSIDYIKLIPYLIASIKELDKKINKLKEDGRE